MTELLPCPFCGKSATLDEPKMIFSDGTAWTYIWCTNWCGVKPHAHGSANTFYYDYEQRKNVRYRTDDEAKEFSLNQAIERWNTRN